MQVLMPIATTAHTILFQYGYGILVALSLIVGLFFLWRRARSTSLSEEKVFDIACISIAFSFIAGRALFFLIGNPPYERTLFNFFIPYVFPGFSFIGIFFGFWAMVWLLTWRMKEPWNNYARLFSVPAFIVIAIMLFLNFARTGYMPLLYAAAMGVIAIVALLLVEARIRKEQLPAAMQFPMVVAFTGAIAFFAGIGYILSLETLAALALLLIGIVWSAVALRYKFTK